VKRIIDDKSQLFHFLSYVQCLLDANKTAKEMVLVA
jgi:hypothetical protein|tara:strand:+ start:470 stop:577 length:108 start_codon:yes stop_codon:yes gene_type:complete